jgi:acetolactate synthase-1/2/3 large subunit
VIGARAVLETLLACGVDTCFMNPGTSEMHAVAALDDVPAMRPVLALFEGVATGAADGYGRMAGRPAATLLHLGPGMANGMANLHNARRARTPLVNVVGDHATYHQPLDAPLQSDIDTVAATFSSVVLRPGDRDRLAAATAQAVDAAVGPPGGVATLVLPADLSWSEGSGPAGPVPPSRAAPPDPAAIADAAQALATRGDRTVILVGGDATRRPALDRLGELRARTGAQLVCETFPARLERGAGITPLVPLAYLAEMAADQLAGATDLILVGAAEPVSFFAYPGKPSRLAPPGSRIHVVAPPGTAAGPALDALAAELGPLPRSRSAEPSGEHRGRPGCPQGSGSLSAEVVNQAVGALLPEGAIVSDESATSGFRARGFTASAPPHDWLTLTGGAIGQGLPVATGAAVACPDRPVLALQADGSAMYTVQALWTMAREGLDVVVIVYNNRSYAILNLELDRVGADAGGPRARSMLDLSRPPLDFVALARGLGVPAERVDTPGGFSAALAKAFAEPGPYLLEAVLA